MKKIYFAIVAAAFAVTMVKALPEKAPPESSTFEKTKTKTLTKDAGHLHETVPIVNRSNHQSEKSEILLLLPVPGGGLVKTKNAALASLISPEYYAIRKSTAPTTTPLLNPGENNNGRCVNIKFCFTSGLSGFSPGHHIASNSMARTWQKNAKNI